MVRIPNQKSLWRTWLRHESPRRHVVYWSRPYKACLLLICLVIAAVSSLHWLVEPNLRSGIPAPFDSIAPKDASVEDTAALQQKRTKLIPSTFVQVIDEKETSTLKQNLERQLSEIELVAKSKNAGRIGPVNLTNKEQAWLSSSSKKTVTVWEKTIEVAANRMLSQGLINTLARDQLQNAASIQLSDIYNQGTPPLTLGSKLISNTFYGRSNLRTDPARSQRLLEELVTKQGIPTIEIKKGDLITRKGQPISPQAYEVLDHFGMISRSPRPFAWLGRFIEALACCGVLLLVMRRERPCLQARHGLLALGLLLITQGSKVWFGAAVSPLAVIVPPTLLIAQGLGTTSALAWMAIGSFLWPNPISGFGEGRMIVACAVAAVVALQAGSMRSRAQLLQMAVVLPLGALTAEWFLIRNQIGSSNSDWSRLAPNSNELVSEAMLMGALMMLAILLIPLLESTFGLITRARLMELADQERPLLRKLSLEAPGTFEHTLMLSGLAEEGARSIGADVDLVRTGALYHDVGKLHAPQWFIENQTNGKNPHDEIDDPYLSANVLQAHVDEGLKLAKRYRLPRPIADFIPEHQGTLKMGYFLHRAREKDPSISEDDFRYRGPIPRSRETAILMLADGCEAALRSLDQNTTDKQASQTVRQIIRTRQRDGQLKESSLSRAEVEMVVRSFVRVWRRMRHRRISYPIAPRKAYPA